MILIRNATVLDPATGSLTESASVVVEGERIREVSAATINVSATLTLDAGGRTLMPGLIDSHVHVFLSEVNIRALEAIPLTLMTARGAGLMRAMLDRGIHDRPGHRRRRLGDSRGRGARPRAGAAALRRRPADRADQRAQRLASPNRHRLAVPLL
jgi:predicted amidohydrolase YtcJ